MEIKVKVLTPRYNELHTVELVQNVLNTTLTQVYFYTQYSGKSSIDMNSGKSLKTK